MGKDRGYDFYVHNRDIGNEVGGDSNGPESISALSNFIGEIRSAHALASHMNASSTHDTKRARCAGSNHVLSNYRRMARSLRLWSG